MNFDLHNPVQAKVGLAPTRIASDTTTVGAVIDTQGFDACEIYMMAGTLTTAGATLALVIETDSIVGFSSPAALPAAQRLGALPSFVGTQDNQIQKVGVKLATLTQGERFIRVSVVSTGTAAAAHDVAVAVVLGRAAKTPVSQPTA